MALIVETGTGLANAESYVSVTEANAYFAGRNNAVWDAADTIDKKEPALRKAAQYIDAEYRFKGDRYSRAQALSWPRLNIVFDGYELPINEIPRQVKWAACELALRAISGELLSDVAAQYASEVKVGPIVKKMSDVANGGQKRFSLVDALLSEFVLSGSGSSSVRVVRA